MASRRLLAAAALAAAIAGTASARCNSVSVSVDGTVEPYVAGAMVRVDVEPTSPAGGDSVNVWPDADGRFSASLWYSTSIKGPIGAVFGDDCTRKPKGVLLSLVAGDRTLATTRVDVPTQVDALGNYRVKGQVTLRSDGRAGAN